MFSKEVEIKGEVHPVSTQRDETLATISSEDGRVWLVTDPADGRLLVRLEGAERRVLGSAAASLVADHGLPKGQWSPCGHRHYVYVAVT